MLVEIKYYCIICLFNNIDLNFYINRLPISPVLKLYIKKTIQGNGCAPTTYPSPIPSSSFCKYHLFCSCFLKIVLTSSMNGNYLEIHWPQFMETGFMEWGSRLRSKWTWHLKEKQQQQQQVHDEGYFFSFLNAAWGN